MLKRKTPEALGIPSKALYNFITHLDSLKLPMHSLLISRYDHLALECYYKPFTANTLHRMFSISKNFTSIAIGQLAKEGLLDLKDPIYQHFPEYNPSSLHPWIKGMSIENLLTMQTCHKGTTFKLNSNDDWVRSFFETSPSHRSSTSFSYDTSSSHTLCALVEKTTGMAMLDYLRQSCLEAIGFSQEAYMLQDPAGRSMGGSGLMALPSDLMKFAQLISHEGRWNNKALLSSSYIRQATSYQVSTEFQGPFPETRHGYGYQFWLIRDGNFACYGMGGQLIIFLPDQDLIVVTTADTQGIEGGVQSIYDSLFSHIIPHLSKSAVPPVEEDSHQLKTLLGQLAIQPLRLSSRVDPDPLVTQGQFKLIVNPHGFETMELSLDPAKKEGQLAFTLKGQAYLLQFGLNRMVPSTFPFYKDHCISSGTWTSSDTFIIKSHIIDQALGSVQFQLSYREGGLSIEMHKVVEASYDLFTGYLESQSSS